MAGNHAQPSYIALHERGELARRRDAALAALADCRLCPRACGVDRTAGDTGFCGAGRLANIASYTLHWGEEAPLVGEVGSGTVFFSGCNLGCSFCQNADISTDAAAGLDAAPDELAGVMLQLQRQGAANINLVSPSHVAAQVLEALPIAVEHGLALPIVYNCGGYDSVETLRLLDGVVDVYMPDAKVWDEDAAARILGARDYPGRARAAIAEMHRQVGDLALDESGLAVRGLLVRHLLLPGGMEADLAGTRRWLPFLAGLSTGTYINIMGQYRPCHRAGEHPELLGPVSGDDVARARELAASLGLERLDGAPGLWRLAGR